jgi:hypothetical protein
VEGGGDNDFDLAGDGDLAAAAAGLEDFIDSLADELRRRRRLPVLTASSSDFSLSDDESDDESDEDEDEEEDAADDEADLELLASASLSEVFSSSSLLSSSSVVSTAELLLLLLPLAFFLLAVLVRSLSLSPPSLLSSLSSL